jgi:hypothetical protein
VLDDRGSIPDRGKNFLFVTASRSILDSTQLSTQLGLGVLSSEVKRPGRKADHSPPSGA